MNLTYENLKNNNINDLIEKINNAETVYINLEPNNKECLFILGLLFAVGKKITIINKYELDLTTLPKSFSIMSYVWELLTRNSFPQPDFSDVNTKLEIIVENIKRLGFKVKPIINNPIENKIFLICPVRNASENVKKEIEDYAVDKTNEGFIIHAPHLHTIQQDILGGYTICLQNAKAIASSTRIDIYYDPKSTGTAFDLGVAYYLNKPLNLLNKNAITLNSNDFIDNLIKNWPYKQEIKIKKLYKE